MLRNDIWELLAILSNLQKTSDVLLMWLSATMQKIYWEFIKMSPGNLLEIFWLTRMWANAQPDGRPAEHRWRPLFNAAKFG